MNYFDARGCSANLTILNNYIDHVVLDIFEKIEQHHSILSTQHREEILLINHSYQLIFLFTHFSIWLLFSYLFCDCYWFNCYKYDVL